MRTPKLLITALVACACSMNALAQKKEIVKDKEMKEVKGPDHEGPGRMNLTADQEKKMKEIRTRTMKDVLPMKNQLGEKRAHLKTLEQSDKPDMNDINKTIDEMTALKSGIMKKQVAAKMEVRSLLTDEQKVMFDARGSKKMGKGRPGKPGPHKHELEGRGED
jgi:Spy/CpxP family protein refolding chaperone